MSHLSELQVAVVGVGTMGAVHARALASGRISGARLAAVCDVEPEARQRFAPLPGFSSCSELIASGVADALLIATPHYDHAPLATQALAAGLHVLVEKPIAVHKAECERMLEAYAARPEPSQVFAAMFSMRTDPRYLKLRELIGSGALGALQRVNWIVTDLFRTEAYFRDRPWRGTWQGEGGGVLLNQCPHVLDLWQWLFGMPARVHAFCGFGRFHDIEVEDQVTAYLEYENGLSGVFVTSTGEAPGTNRLEVAGALGRVVVERAGLSFTRNEVSSAVCSKLSPSGNGAPKTSHVVLPLAPLPEPRQRVIQNFVNAIRQGEKVIAPAIEGIHSVELANAMIQSARLQQTVLIPLDALSYSAELARLVGSSKQAPLIALK